MAPLSNVWEGDKKLEPTTMVVIQYLLVFFVGLSTSALSVVMCACCLGKRHRHGNDDTKVDYAGPSPTIIRSDYYKYHPKKSLQQTDLVADQEKKTDSDSPQKFDSDQLKQNGSKNAGVEPKSTSMLKETRPQITPGKPDYASHDDPHYQTLMDVDDPFTRSMLGSVKHSQRQQKKSVKLVPNMAYRDQSSLFI